MSGDTAGSRPRVSHADCAQELYYAQVELLGWAHSILNAESPEDGKAGLLSVGDRLDTWPRKAAASLVTLRQQVADARAENAKLRQALEASEREREESDATWMLQADALRRATERWHAAGGDPKVLPDYADLVLWLLTEWDKARDLLRRTESDIADGFWEGHFSILERSREIGDYLDALASPAPAGTPSTSGDAT